MIDADRLRLPHPLTDFCFFLSLLFAMGQEPKPLAVEPVCGMYKGANLYMGTMNKTNTGKACQPWALNSPHAVDAKILFDISAFSDGSLESAENFCRNPTMVTRKGLWCYTMEPNVEWEYCDACQGGYEGYNGCALSDKGANYRGNLDRTQSHTECQPWKDHPNDQFKFPEGSAKKAKNHCRNPDPKTYEAPWCFIADMPDKPWEYCDICKPFHGQVTRKPGSNSFAIEKIPDMSRLACIHWCINMGACAGVAVPKNGKECLFFTRLDGEPIAKDDWEQYIVTRVCRPKSKGQEAYFVTIDNSKTVNAGKYLKYEKTYVKCDEYCINIESCAYYQWTYEDGWCRVYDRIWEFGMEYTDDFALIVRIPIRCDPSLDDTDVPEPEEKEEADAESSSEVVDAEPSSQEENSEPSSEENNAEPSSEENHATDSNAAGGGKSLQVYQGPKKRKKKKKKTISKKDKPAGLTVTEATGSSTNILVIALAAGGAIIALGGGGFAYYKLVYLKGKDKDKDKDKDKGKGTDKDKDTGKDTGKDKGKDKDKGKRSGSKEEREKLNPKKQSTSKKP